MLLKKHSYILFVVCTAVMGVGVLIANTPLNFSWRLKDIRSSESSNLHEFFRLANASAESGVAVRVLFFGQSITEQIWWQSAAASIRVEFPNSTFIIENRAIGGHSAERLKLLVDSEVSAFQPDLVVLHVYGASRDYLNVVRGIRKSTTADMVVATDHITSEVDLNEVVSSHCLFESRLIRSLVSKIRSTCAGTSYATWFNYSFLPSLVDKYGLQLFDVRSAWKAELMRTGKEPKAFLSDAIHLNEYGNRLMATSFSESFKSWKSLFSSTLVDRVPTRTSQANINGGKPTSLPDGVYRIDIAKYRCKTKSDDRNDLHLSTELFPKSKAKDFYSSTISSFLPGSKWPAIIKIDMEASVPKIGIWAMRIDKVHISEKHWGFSVYDPDGNFAGAGSSNKKFVTLDQNLSIVPSSWNRAFAFDQQHVGLQQGTILTWRVARNNAGSEPVVLQAQRLIAPQTFRVTKDPIGEISLPLGCSATLIIFAAPLICTTKIFDLCLVEELQ
jgi:hypothetical protein